MTIAWQPYSDELFRVARDERRALLLFLTARWSRFCGAMERGAFADPAVQRAVSELAIAVRVDKDERPDLDARYGPGGWPAVVLLDPDGEVLSAANSLDAPALLERLLAAGRRLRTEGPAPRPARPPPGQPSGRLDDSILPAVDAALLAHFDSRDGGFGTGQKFPHPEALDYAILRLGDGSAHLRELVEKTLAHLAEGGLHDAVDGGFFRFCATRDWRQPHTEKLLEANAGLARNFLEAGQRLQRADFLRTGARTAEALPALFLDPHAGLFHASLDADDDWYARDAAGRRTRRPPRPDGRFLADANARAVSALLKAGAVLRRAELTRTALEVAQALLARLWLPGRGVFHVEDAAGRHQPGLLRDQAELARMLLHVLQYTDDRRCLPPLQDLLDLLSTRHVAPDGALVDAPGAGTPRRPDAAIVDAAIAAEALLRGALFTARPELHDVARRALERHAGDFRRHGYAMAPYGRAAELVLHPPLHVVVVGAQGDARAEALARAASETWLPSRVVQRLDPTGDAALLARLELPAEGPVAYLFLARAGAAEHRDPLTLWAALAAANQRRLATTD